MNLTRRMLRIALLLLNLFSLDLFTHAFFVPTPIRRHVAKARASTVVRSPSCIIPPSLSCSTGDGETPGDSIDDDKDDEPENTPEVDTDTSAEPILLLPGESRAESRRKRMELSWCNPESCLPYTNSREKVAGENNDIEFSSPATGQVVYGWADHATDGDEGGDISPVNLPRVLLLVKRNDDAIMEVAANAVRELTAKGGIKVMLQPEVAAKFKHYFGVNDDMIELFEVKSEPGFGGNHLALDDPLYNTHTFDDDDDNVSDNNYPPDLVCTLGGDGLLMYASTLFSGPCPPILCVAGGSLGFLTPFSKDEMVNAIQVSLGLAPTEVYESDGQEEGSVGQKESLSVMRIGNFVVPERETKFELGVDNLISLSLRMRLECQVTNREGIVRARFNVLNEVVIDRGNSPYLAALECFCDDVHLTTVQADGVIFSTPTGSTAYGMSAGGPVAHPAVPAIFLTPICPHVLSFRSMVFPDHVVLRCFVAEDARSDAAVAFDGKYRRELHRGDSVQIKMSPYPVPTINRADHSADWLTSLKRNFNFNTRARQAPL